MVFPMGSTYVEVVQDGMGDRSSGDIWPQLRPDKRRTMLTAAEANRQQVHPSGRGEGTCLTS